MAAALSILEVASTGATILLAAVVEQVEAAPDPRLPKVFSPTAYGIVIAPHGCPLSISK